MPGAKSCQGISTHPFTHGATSLDWRIVVLFVSEELGGRPRKSPMQEVPWPVPRVRPLMHIVTEKCGDGWIVTSAICECGIASGSEEELCVRKYHSRRA